MKTCPECKSTYTDDTLTKCPEDGTELVEDNSLNENTSAETVEFNKSEKTKEKIAAKTSPAVDVKSVKSDAPQKSKGNSYLILVVAVVLVLLGVLWWYSQKPKNTTTAKTQSKDAINNAKSNTTAPNPTRERKPPTMTDYPVGGAQSPTEAYKMLFAAVKSQETEKIKSMYSKGSIGLAEMQAARSNQPLERVYENGFTETTFVDDFPKMRDERIKDQYGAVEVWNEMRKQWDDIPFIFEDGSWKLAIGDAFAGTYKSPGKGQAAIEQENANANNPNLMIKKIPTDNSNTNFRSGGKVTKPKNQ